MVVAHDLQWFYFKGTSRKLRAWVNIQIENERRWLIQVTLSNPAHSQEKVTFTTCPWLFHSSWAEGTISALPDECFCVPLTLSPAVPWIISWKPTRAVKNREFEMKEMRECMWTWWTHDVESGMASGRVNSGIGQPGGAPGTRKKMPTSLQKLFFERSFNLIRVVWRAMYGLEHCWSSRAINC